MSAVLNRTTVFALLFWGLLAGFIALDWMRATPHNRFDEPPPWALGQPAQDDGGAHCSAPLKK
jgi:hypothetical protein